LTVLAYSVRLAEKGLHSPENVREDRDILLAHGHTSFVADCRPTDGRAFCRKIVSVCLLSVCNVCIVAKQFVVYRKSAKVPMDRPMTSS